MARVVLTKVVSMGDILSKVDSILYSLSSGSAYLL
jgi:hypothetical protein